MRILTASLISVVAVIISGCGKTKSLVESEKPNKDEAEERLEGEDDETEDETENSSGSEDTSNDEGDDEPVVNLDVARLDSPYLEGWPEEYRRLFQQIANLKWASKRIAVAAINVDKDHILSELEIPDKQNSYQQIKHSGCHLHKVRRVVYKVDHRLDTDIYYMDIVSFPSAVAQIPQKCDLGTVTFSAKQHHTHSGVTSKTVSKISKTFAKDITDTIGPDTLHAIRFGKIVKHVLIPNDYSPKIEFFAH
jgi:hypothetical protein